MKCVSYCIIAGSPARSQASDSFKMNVSMRLEVPRHAARPTRFTIKKLAFQRNDLKFRYLREMQIKRKDERLLHEFKIVGVHFVHDT